jgi:hypothetical protein
MSKKQVRKNFRDSVFSRDGYRCRICGNKPLESEVEQYLDSHHILDRNSPEFNGTGGYVKENGITLCKYDENGSEEDSCHMKAERFHISGGVEWEEGMHPDDLYKMIGSSKELAIEKSANLK